MENYSIKDLMKANHVMRWHTVDTVRQQSLAEHQWSVCMIAVNLALLMGLEDLTISSIQTKALVHDIEEIWTGDIPSPYKEYLKRTGASPSVSGLGVGAYAAGISLVRDDGPPRQPQKYEDTLVMAADRIDAWWWSKRYVQDPSVVVDCEQRLNKFISDVASPALRTAMVQLTKVM